MKKTIIAAAVGLCLSGGSSAVDIIGSLAKDGAIYMTIEVNGVKGGEMVEVEKLGNRFFIDKADLQQFGVTDLAGRMDIGEVDPNAVINIRKLHLSFQLPLEKFGGQSTSFRQEEDIFLLDRGYGAWVNYDIYATGTKASAGVQAAFSINGSTPYGSIVSQHVYNSLSETTLRRTGTTLRRDDVLNQSAIELGDTSSLPSNWGAPVRFAGIRLSRDFSMRQNNYLPTFTATGEATTASVVEIWEGSRKTYTGKVDPGTFSITDYPGFTGTGQAKIIVRDVFGNETVRAINIFQSPQLLGHNKDSYSMELGMLRRGEKYGDTFFGISYRRGFGLENYSLLDRLSQFLPNVTLDARIEGTVDDIRIGGGVAFASWLGNVSLSAAIGDKNSPSARAIAEDRLADTAAQSANTGSNVAMTTTPRTPSVLNASWDRMIDFGSMGKGSAYFNLSKPKDWVPVGLATQARKTMLAGFSYFPFENLSVNFVGTKSGEGETASSSKTIGVGTTFRNGVAASATITAAGKENTMLMSILIPLDKVSPSGLLPDWARGFGAGKAQDAADQKTDFWQQGTVTTTISKADTYAAYSGWNETMSTRWNIGVGRSGETNRLDTSFSSQLENIRIGGFAYQNGDRFGYRVGGSGAFALAGTDFFVTKKILNNLVVIDAGRPGVGLSANNRPIGTTDSSGKVVTGGLVSFANNKVTVAGSEDYTLTSESSAVIAPFARSVSYIKLGVADIGRYLVIKNKGIELRNGAVVSINGTRLRYVAGAGLYTNEKKGRMEISVSNCTRNIDLEDQDEIELSCN